MDSQIYGLTLMLVGSFVTGIGVALICFGLHNYQKNKN